MAMLNLSSSFSSRRSHLHSATYLTLVRIYSLCPDGGESPKPSQLQNPNPRPCLDSESNGNSKSKGVAYTDDSQRQPADDSNLVDSNSQLAEETGNPKGNDEKGEAFANSAFEVLFDIERELEVDDECIDEELLQCITTDCAKLIDGSADDASLLSNNQENTKVEVQNGSFGFEKEANIIAEVSNSTDELKCEESGECFNTIVENARELGVGTQQEACTNSCPSESEDYGDRNLEDGEADGEDFEEGEIPNDLDNSNQSLDSVHECEDKKLEEGSASEGFDKNGSSIFTDGHCLKKENYFRNGSSSISQGIKAFADDGSLKPEKKKSCGDAAVAYVEQKATDPCPNEENRKPSVTEVVQVQVKKKRAAISEERKAKKKIAKKRKRAQKDREQGVKRLKLQPVVKPKEVKYCNFYLVGKCQQGDSCKFSHDTTPLTKSQPCKYFACDCCLKGDDCPFDHQLSKYPCHNYEAKGMCIRGDRCKFSHKLPEPENSSPASVASKADTVPSSWKSNSTKQPHMNRTSLGAIDQCKSAAAASTSSHLTIPNPAAGKEPAQIPNGIRFLSFGKQKAEQQKKEKSVAPAHKNVLSFAQRSHPVAQSEKKNVMPSTPVNSNARRTANGFNKKSNDGGLQDEVSEASKLLEEFLFCGAS